MDISTQIITVLDDLCRRFGLVIDWSQENVIPYLQELAGKYISWEMATSWALVGVAAVMLVVAVIGAVIDLRSDLPGPGCLVAIFLACGAIALGITQMGDILTCKYFP